MSLKDFFHNLKIWIIKFEKKSKDYFSAEGADIYTRLVRRIFLSFVLAGVIAGFVIIIILLIARISYPITKVPDVREKDIVSAITELQKRGLNVIIEPTFNTNYAKFTVISQFPFKGLTVRKGRSVTLVVSLGRDVYTVPNLVGLSKKEAEDILTKENIPFMMTLVKDGNYPLDKVISQEPSPGLEVERTYKMKLLVNSDVEEGKFKVENYINQPIEVVLRALIQNSIYPVLEKKVATSPDEDGKVLEQDIPAGAILPINSEIRLLVGVYGESEEEIRSASYRYFYYNLSSLGGEQIASPELDVKILISDEKSTSREIYSRKFTDKAQILTVFKSYGPTKLVLIVNNSVVKEVSYE
ncbi:MAG: PASTA domain-containing protein [Brevinematia bacterium]